MSFAKLRGNLDDLVWSDDPHIYSSALDTVQWTDIATRELLFQWAREKYIEYSDRHKKIRKKCDIHDAGVFVIYEHYLKISERYRAVAEAMDVRFGSRRIA